MQITFENFFLVLKVLEILLALKVVEIISLILYKMEKILSFIFSKWLEISTFTSKDFLKKYCQNASAQKKNAPSEKILTYYQSFISQVL